MGSIIREPLGDMGRWCVAGFIPIPHRQWGELQTPIVVMRRWATFDQRRQSTEISFVNETSKIKRTDKSEVDETKNLHKMERTGKKSAV